MEKQLAAQNREAEELAASPSRFRAANFWNAHESVDCANNILAHLDETEAIWIRHLRLSRR